MATETSTTVQYTGQVKWFNTHSGYGFITALDGEQVGKDIFIHHSVIRAADPQSRFLVDGEYVEFALTPSTTGNHEFQASNVTGIKGGSLLCDRPTTRRSEGGDRQYYDNRRSNYQGRGGRGGQGRRRQVQSE